MASLYKFDTSTTPITMYEYDDGLWKQETLSLNESLILNPNNTISLQKTYSTYNKVEVFALTADPNDDSGWYSQTSETYTDLNGNPLLTEPGSGAGDDGIIDDHNGDSFVDDSINGTDGHDLEHAGGGDDRLDGAAGDDDLYGDDGDDHLNGDDGNDVLVGGTGFDVLSGGLGHDELNGEADDDLLEGGEGSDDLDGGQGDDTLDGGDGIDTAVYAGNREQYTLYLDRAHKTLTITDSRTSGEGQDHLSNIEKLQFGNQTFELVNPALEETPSYGHTRSFLFDSAYYLLSHPELASSVTVETADDHYLSTGAALGYQPNAWFDPTYYKSKWADLQGLDDATLFMHHNLYGVWEGRSAGQKFDHYDGARYLRDNPDVAAYVDAHLADFLGSQSNGALAHYLIHGTDEGRIAYEDSGNMIDTTILIGVSP